MFYSVGSFRTSSNPERTALRRQGEEPGYTEVLQQRAGSLNIKRLLLSKENQISQVKEFSTLLRMGSLKSCYWYAPQLSGTDFLFSHPEFPQDSPDLWWLQLLITVTSFDYWYVRRDLGSDPWVGKIPWRRVWQPTLVFLPGESPWTEEPCWVQSIGLQSQTWLSN